MSVATLRETCFSSICLKNSATFSREPPPLPVTIVVTPMRTKFSACGSEVMLSVWV